MSRFLVLDSSILWQKNSLRWWHGQLVLHPMHHRRSPGLQKCTSCWPYPSHPHPCLDLHIPDDSWSVRLGDSFGSGIDTSAPEHHCLSSQLLLYVFLESKYPMLGVELSSLLPTRPIPLNAHFYSSIFIILSKQKC
jgi:hypothetical protein